MFRFLKKKSFALWLGLLAVVSLFALAMAAFYFNNSQESLEKAQAYIGQTIDHEVPTIAGGVPNTFVDTGSTIGDALAVIGDLNQDGTDDYAVGVRLADKSGNGDEGMVQILFMNGNGTVQSTQEISTEAGNFTPGLSRRSYFGEAVAGIGDLDGDGVVDLAVGAPADSSVNPNPGSAYILFLNPDGTVKNTQQITTGVGGLSANLATDDSFGAAVSSLGDIDGDGVNDLAVGAPLDQDGSGTDKGAIYVLRLNTDGTVKSEEKISETQNNPGFVLTSNGNLGSAVTGGQDVDGDGINDVIAGASSSKSNANLGGKILVLFLNADGTVKGSQEISAAQGGFNSPIQSQDGFGEALTFVGDLDADTVPDLAVGSTSNDAANPHKDTSLHLLFLNTNGTVKNSIEIGEGKNGFGEDLEHLNNFGAALASSPSFDLNNDTNRDLVVGVPGNDILGQNQGGLYTLFLDASYQVQSSQKIDDNEGGLPKNFRGLDIYGYNVSLIGDVDGDGINDMAATGRLDDEVLIIFLNADSTVKAFQRVALSLDGLEIDPVNIELDASRIGAGVAGIGDLDDDGVPDIVLGSLEYPTWGYSWVVFLNSDGTAKSHTKIDISSLIGQGPFDPSAQNGYFDTAFGNAVEGMGDVDGDGVEDIAIGMYEYDDNIVPPDQGVEDKGGIAIFFMNTDGTVKSSQLISDNVGGLSGVTFGGGHLFGSTLGNLGDIDGDGINDLGVTSINNTRGPATTPSTLYVLLLNSDGTVKDTTLFNNATGAIASELSNDSVLSGISGIGDIDGDGTVDIAIGDTEDNDGGNEHGAMYLLLMNPDGTAKDYQKISDTEGDFDGIFPDDYGFGLAIEYLGDLDNDGGHNIAVGGFGPGFDVPFDQGDVQILDIATNASHSLEFTKTVDQSDILPGETVEYTLNYNNTGSTTLTGVSIVDILPPELTYVPNSCTGGCSEVSTGVLEWNIGTLPPGSGSVLFQATLNPTNSQTSVTNGAGIDSNELPSQEVDVTTPILSPNLTLNKTSDKAAGALPGETVTYTLNWGTDSRDNNGIITDSLNADLNYVPGSCTGNCTETNGTLTWSLGDLATGASGAFTYQAIVDINTAQTSITNTATFSADTAASQNASANVPILRAGLNFNKAATQNNLLPGETVEYTLSYLNVDTATLTNVSIEDMLPPGLTYVANSCSGGCSENNGVLTWNIGSLASGVSGDVTFKAALSNTFTASSVSNTATIDTDQTSPQDTTDTTPVLYPNLTLSKTNNSGAGVLPGNPVEYTLDWSVDKRVYNVALSDPLNGDLNYVPGSCSGGCSENNGVLTWNLGDLSGAANGSFTFEAVVDTSTSQSSLANTATLTADNASSQNATSQVTILNTGLNFTKTATQSNLLPGETVEYTLSYTNSGSATLTGVTLEDTLPSGLAYIPNSCSGGCTENNGTLTWNPGNLLPNATGSVSFEANLSQTFTAANVSNVTSLDTDQTDAQTATETTPVLYPNLTLNKTNNRPGGALPGETVEYTLDWSVDKRAYNVILSDPLNGNLNYVPNSCTGGCVVDNGTLTWDLGDLNGAGNGSFTFEAQIDSNTTQNSIANTATLTADSTTPRSQTSNVAILTSGLNFTKTAAQSDALPGETLTYTLNYANTGSAALTGAVITDTLPNDLTYVPNSCSNGCNENNGVLTWNLGTLSNQDTGSVTFQAQVNTTTNAIEIINTATLDTDQTDPLTRNEATQMLYPNLSLTKTNNRPDGTLPGESVEYTLTWSTDKRAYNVTLSDALPADLTYVPNSCSNGCSENNGTLTWNLGNQTSARNGTVSFEARINATTTRTEITNTGSLSANNADSASAQSGVSILGAELSLSKTASPASGALPGEEISYALTAVNAGAADLTGVTLRDALPADLTYVPNSCSGGCSENNGTVTWNLGNFAADNSQTFEFRARLSQNTTATTIVNSALLESNEADSVTENITTPILYPNLGITKNVNVSGALPGDTVAYTVNFTTDKRAYDVRVSDTLPTDLTYVSCTANPGTPGSCSESNGVVTWNAGDLSQATAGSFVITARVNENASQNTLTNTARVEANNAALQEDETSFDVLSAGLAFTKIVTTGNGGTLPGEELSYTLTYRNTGTSALTGVILSDNLPDEVALISGCQDSCTTSDNDTLVWNVGNVAVGGEESFTVLVQIDPDITASVLTNTAQIDSDQTEPETASVEATILYPNLTLTKTSDLKDGILPEQEVTYTLDWAVDKRAFNVRLVDTLPANLRYVPDSCSDDCTEENGTLTWTLGDLAGAQNQAVTFKAKLIQNPSAVSVINAATLSANNALSVTAEDTLPVRSAELVLNKQAPGTVESGRNLSFNLRTSNTGDVPLTDVIVTDILDPDLEFIDCTNQCQVEGQTLRWNLETLDPETTVSLQITTRTRSDFAGTISNQATGTSTQTEVESNEVRVQVTLPESPVTPPPVTPRTGGRSLLFTLFGMSIVGGGLYLLRRRNKNLAKISL